MDTTCTSDRVRQCSKCSGDVESFCISCQCDPCPLCKENHLKDIKTLDRNDMTYRGKINNIPPPECETSQQCLY